MTDPSEPSPEAPAGDVWLALEELATVVNDMAAQVAAHARLLEQPQPATPVRPRDVGADELREWVQALVEEYGLHAQIGPPQRWESIPPVRAELIGLKIADVRGLKLPQGSFELLYWHDALARVVERVTRHADRWQQDQQNQSLLRRSA